MVIPSYLNITRVYNYYPFGSQIPSMTWEDTDARFGFQGQQRDDEIAGKGNSLATYFRLNSPQTGRWLSIDPKADKYPGSSPYTLYGNSPIVMVDPRGDAPYAKKLDGTWKYINSSLSSDMMDKNLGFIPMHGWGNWVKGRITNYRSIEDNFLSENLGKGVLSVFTDLSSEYMVIPGAGKEMLGRFGGFLATADVVSYYSSDYVNAWAKNEIIFQELEITGKDYETVCKKYQTAARVIDNLINLGDITFTAEQWPSGNVLLSYELKSNALLELTKLDGALEKDTYNGYRTYDIIRKMDIKALKQFDDTYMNVQLNGTKEELYDFEKMFPDYKSSAKGK